MINDRDIITAIGIFVTLVIAIVITGLVIGNRTNANSTKKCSQIAKLSNATDWRWHETGCIIIKDGKVTEI